MSKNERDQLIEGHEYDGIQELDNPLPKWWLYVFYATVAISRVYFIIYPAIPFISGHTTGILGYSTRKALDASVEEADTRVSTRTSPEADGPSGSMPPISCDLCWLRPSAATAA